MPTLLDAIDAKGKLAVDDAGRIVRMLMKSAGTPRYRGSPSRSTGSGSRLAGGSMPTIETGNI